MDLDTAFKLAVKKFYDGIEYKNVDKYAKNGFQYSYKNLDDIQNEFKNRRAKEKDV